MKQALPIFCLLVLAGWLLTSGNIPGFVSVLAPPQVAAQPTAAPAPTALTPISPTPVPPTVRLATGIDPRQLVKDAFAKVDSYGSVSAKIRQRAELYGISMFGSGTYIQGSTPSHRMRLEMTLQLGNRKASIQQIADGDYLWTRRELASAPTLSRVNIDRVLEVQEQANHNQPFLNNYVIGLGGLPRALLSLQRCFDFDTVAETSLGGMSVYVLRGVWNRESLAHLLQDQKQAIRAGTTPDLTKLAEQVPDEVVVFLGREDLFPYRFEYRRTPAAQTDKSSDAVRLKTLMAVEFYEVQIDESIDTTLFHFEPGEMDFDDETNLYLYRFTVWPQ